MNSEIKEDEGRQKGVVDMDRRTFLTGAATAGTLLAIEGIVGCDPSNTNEQTVENTSGYDVLNDTPSFLIKPEAPSAAQVISEYDCDVLVIGTGTAGNPAVRAAAEAGVSVIGIDKGADVGFVPSSQDFGIIGSQIQKQLGIEWASKNYIVKQLMKDMCYRPNPQLLNYWYENSGEAFDWAIDGVDYQVLNSSIEEPKQEVYIRPKLFPALEGYSWEDEYYPYFHGTLMTLPSCQWVMENCAEKASEAGAQFKYGLYAQQLITDDSGAVIGAWAYDDQGQFSKFNAKAVILCCGDMSGNPEMMQHYVPQAAQFSSIYTRVDTQGNVSNTGDGHRLAMWAGAAMELGPYAPMTHHMGGPLGVDAFLQLNSKGERFMNEDIPGQNIQDQISRQPGGFSWQVIDDKWREELEVQATGHGYVNHYLTAEEAAAKPWILENVFMGYITDEVFLNGKEDVRMKGITFQADTIEELADKMELPVETVDEQINRYNDLCAKGYDEDFGKDTKRMFPIDTPPFYAAKFEQSSLLVCPGGIKCDAELHALDTDDNVVPGLYVAGNNMGGRFLVEYPVTVAGISLGTAIVFGKLAGINAAKGI